MRLFCRKYSLLDTGLLGGAVDSHSHILYGVDDGVRTIEESLEAIAREEKAGVTQIWCTPHVMEDIPNTTASLKRRFEQLASAYSGGVKLCLAAEYMIDTLFDERLSARDLLVIRDDEVLVETSVWTPPLNMADRLKRLQSIGYYPLLAHPERYRYMSIDDYKELHEMGVRFQLNLPSVAGLYGDSVRKKAFRILEMGMYSSIGTDCHRAGALQKLFTDSMLSKDEARRLTILSEVV